MGHFEINRYNLRIRRDSAGRGQARAAFLTDLHSSPWGSRYDLLIDAVCSEDPDFILIGGDMITAVPGTATDDIEELMRELTARFPVYYGCGNHEYRLRLYTDVYGEVYKKFFAALKEAGVIFLPDRKARTRINGIQFDIYGFNIKRKFYKRFHKTEMPVSAIEKVFDRPSEDAVSILLAHTPKYMETYLEWGADLTLCGHNHGGIVRLGKNIGVIDPDLSLFSKRSKGRFGSEEKTCIVSAGLGEHTIKLRFNNPRELVMLNFCVGS